MSVPFLIFVHKKFLKTFLCLIDNRKVLNIMSLNSQSFKRLLLDEGEPFRRSNSSASPPQQRLIKSASGFRKSSVQFLPFNSVRDPQIFSKDAIIDGKLEQLCIQLRKSTNNLLEDFKRPQSADARLIKQQSFASADEN